MTEIKARAYLSKFEDYQVETVPDADIIVNANETNWDLTPELRVELQTRISENAFNRYPTMHGEELSEQIAKALGVDPATVVIGNGSSELLEKACFAFGGAGTKIAYPSPSFSMYETYAVLGDAEPIAFALTPEGFIDPDAVIAFCQKEKPNALIICNPNNPTGNFNPRSDMEKIIRTVDCLVIMDEAYLEFSKEDGQVLANSTLELTKEVDNLLVLRTFSKAYGLANLRIGYGIGSPAVMRVLKKVLLPYTVNGVSILTAGLVYAKPEVLAQRVRAVVKGREYLREQFTALGFKVLPSATNFILVLPQGKVLDNLAAQAGKSGAEPAAKAKAAGSYLFKQLLKRKILIRDFSQKDQLPGGLRISIGTAQENPEIIAGVKAILAQGEA